MYIYLLEEYVLCVCGQAGARAIMCDMRACNILNKARWIFFANTTL